VPQPDEELAPRRGSTHQHTSPTDEVWPFVSGRQMAGIKINYLPVLFYFLMIITSCVRQ